MMNDATRGMFASRIEELANGLEARLIALRRDFHKHPELSNREFRTGKLVADHLRILGLQVTHPVAHTGVVALLDSGRPGPVVALRADMDALPVKEESGVEFASEWRSEYNGEEVPVAHACGHDAHVAIMLTAAEVLVALRDQLHGQIKFIFQPAEEGPPRGEEGGAALMIKQGVLDNPRPDAIFGLHVIAGIETGKIGYRAGPTMASGDILYIDVHGRQTHGAFPWRGVDPVVVASQIVLGLQTICSRQVDVTLEPSILTVSCIHGGIRANIIPDTVKMAGTIRTFNEAMRQDIHRRVRETAAHIAQASGARAEVNIETLYDVTVNDPDLTERMVPTLRRVAGESKVFIAPKLTGSEDFSCYQKQVPGLFFFLGITPGSGDVDKAAPNHSPYFFVDESGLLLGVKALVHLTVDYMHGV